MLSIIAALALAIIGIVLVRAGWREFNRRGADTLATVIVMIGGGGTAALIGAVWLIVIAFRAI